MKLRSLDILDLPLLPRFRREVLILDSARNLTHGNPLGARALLSYLNPNRHIYTGVASSDGKMLLGQVMQHEEQSAARMTFLAPERNAETHAAALLDHLTAQAGAWGATHLRAEVEERAPAFDLLRQAGFAMYAWQRIWKLPPLNGRNGSSAWRPTQDGDWITVQGMHNQIVPGLFQPVEALPKGPTGLVCQAGGNLQAFVLVSSGPAGIYLLPLVPPESGCAPERLRGLAGAVSGWRESPIYICVRSYQAWLEAVLEEAGAEASERQAVMVKRLALQQKSEEVAPAIEKALIKPAAPVVRVAIREDRHAKE